MHDNPHIGSSTADFLKGEGLYEDVTAHAIKRVLTWQIAQAMPAEGVTKVEMAKRMKTSRAQLDRLLDPNNDKVQLDTIQRATAAVGRRRYTPRHPSTRPRYASSNGKYRVNTPSASRISWMIVK